MNTWLLRHTKVAVPAGLCYGRSDVPLAPTFDAEAALVSARMPGGNPFIVSSPSIRCRELALRLGPAAASLMATHDYVRQGPSKARPLAQRLPPGRLALVVLLGLAPMAFLPVRFWFSLTGPCLAVLLLGRWFHQRLGGYTGDCLGATQQLGEVAFLLLAVAMP